MRCGGWHELRPSQAAVQAAQDLKAQLDFHHRFDFGLPPGDARVWAGFSTDYVWTKGPGEELGAHVDLACVFY